MDGDGGQTISLARPIFTPPSSIIFWDEVSPCERDPRLASSGSLSAFRAFLDLSAPSLRNT